MHADQMNMVLILVLVLAALWTVMARSLLRSAIGLAFTSAIITFMMFRMDSPIAAVFELSVCTGLISVVFISTISLTQPLARKDIIKHMKDRLARFSFLPILIVAVGIFLSFLKIRFNLVLPPPEVEKDVRIVMWYIRPLEIIGQVIILIAGVFGIVILFREVKKK